MDLIILKKGNAMEIFELKEKDGISDNVKLNRLYHQFQKILTELRKIELPEKIVELINLKIEELNSISYTDKKLKKLIKKNQTKIIQLLEKELKIVPKGYYQTLWLALGMSIFGVPIGTAIALTIMNNMALLGIGFPFGMIIGMCLGKQMDKKAFKEGRQLDVEIKY